MGSVGLLYVGAVLFINGLMLVGLIPGKSAAILNFFVGTMQVIFPTLIILQANNDPAVIFGAAGLYLFGFTYLYVGILQVTGWPGEGLGYFSLFVAICATIIGVIQFTSVNDPVFGSIWLIWAVLWFMFFLVLGLHKETLTLATGWFTILVSFLTGTIPAFLLLLNRYETGGGSALLVAVVGAICLAVAFFLASRGLPHPKTAEDTATASTA